MAEKTILKKVSRDGKRHYRLIRFDDKYVVFKTTHLNGVTEAEFSETLREFSDEEKAKKFFNQFE